VTLKGQTRDPNTLTVHISKTAGDRDSVTDDVTWPQRYCEAVRSAILATAWLLVCHCCWVCLRP